AFVLPATPAQFFHEHLDEVRLDADRAAVAVVRRPSCATFEPADVAERAAMGATCVRVQRPSEAHALDAVERGFARVFAYDDRGHVSSRADGAPAPRPRWHARDSREGAGRGPEALHAARVPPEQERGTGGEQRRPAHDVRDGAQRKAAVRQGTARDLADAVY